MPLAGRLSSWATQIGADIKQLRADLQAKGGSSGAEPWTHQVLTTPYTNSTTSQTPIFPGFTPEADKTYVLDALLMVQSAASTTGVRAILTSPYDSLLESAVRFVTPLTATIDRADTTTADQFSLATTGLTFPNLMTVQAIFKYVPVFEDGPVTLAGASEIAGSLITVHPGSSMRWRKL